MAAMYTMKKYCGGLFFHLTVLVDACKSCQYCLETMYWNCCEERFCFDKNIATYSFEDADPAGVNGYTNLGASLESVVVTEQPANNFTSQIGRETTELPVHADKIYEVFSKSMIFKDENENRCSSTTSLEEVETKSEPDWTSSKPNRTKVYFEDEVNSPITDFEIMFNDELVGSHGMFKIEEEEETPSTTSSPDGLVMTVKQDVIKSSTITIKDQDKITILTPIYKYDPDASANLPSTISLPNADSVKSILKNDFPRSHSAKNLTAVDSTARVHKSLSRVESLKNIETGKINKVLSRVPIRSASFLNIPQHLLPEVKPALKKSDSAFVIGANRDLEFTQISKLPDTPVIKSANLPKFFVDSPALGEYKNETSLQSIKLRADSSIKENDYSMPRYYGTASVAIDPIPVHESKSMPDLRNPISTGKVSKRLVKLRSKLKPLVIKRGTDEK